MATATPAPYMGGTRPALSRQFGFAKSRPMNGRSSATSAHRPQLASGAAFAPVILADHARLPGRFFGRLTAAVLAGLSGR